MIATDTPNKLQIEAEHTIKMEKKRKHEDRTKKRLFQNKNTNGISSNQPKKKKPEGSETSDSDVVYSSESEEEFSVPLEEKKKAP